MVDVTSVTEEAERQLRELYGERMLGYGVRIPTCDDEDDDEPDTEVLVLLKGDFDRWDEVRRMSDIASATGGPRRVFVVIPPLSQDEYDRPPGDLFGQQIREATFVR